MDAAKNQRKHSRLPLQLSAFLRLLDGRKIDGQTRNISFGGAAIARNETFPGALYERVTLGLVLHQGDPPVIATTICDIWCVPEPRQVCAQYVATDIESYGRIRNIILLNTDNPDLLPEELTKRPGLATLPCDAPADDDCKECL